MSDIVQFERLEGLLDIVLTDPAGGNLISNAEGDRIIAALAGIDDSVKLVRIRSTGGDFCLGRVSPMPKPGTPGITAHYIKTHVAEPAIRVYGALADTPVPVLSIVRGRADGYGLGLIGASDIAIASDRAQFSIPEMARQIPPTLVMTALLGRAPAKAVAHLVFSQEPIGAAEAASLGIISKMTPDDRLDDEMDALTARILSYRPEAVRAIKEYLRFSTETGRAAAGSLAANLASAALSARFGA